VLGVGVVLGVVLGIGVGVGVVLGVVFGVVLGVGVGECTVEERPVVNIAEGLDFFVSADHDIVVDSFQGIVGRERPSKGSPAAAWNLEAAGEGIERSSAG
jgi:hypothetical protein